MLSTLCKKKLQPNHNDVQRPGRAKLVFANFKGESYIVKQIVLNPCYVKFLEKTLSFKINKIVLY